MTPAEYGKFANRLFTQFPSLTEWLAKNSPDPAATQELWRNTLRDCSLAECMWVLSKWADGGLTPFAAYERDQVAVIVRSVISSERSKLAAKRQMQVIMKAKQAARSVQASRVASDDASTVNHSSLLDSGMVLAKGRLQPIYKKHLDGEINRAEYDETFERVWSEILEMEKSHAS